MPSKTPFTGFSTIPRGRRLVVIVWVFVAIVICLLTAAVYSVELLAAGRAFVGAEGQWSRAQKDAAFYLTRYAQNGAEEDYRSFERAMAVPLGDRQAREELMKPDPDFALARAGFIAGRNHPQDIDAMMTLFRRFAPFGPVKQAVFLWERADATIALDDRAWAETLLGLQAQRPNARFVSAAPIMRPLRLIKDADELAIMRRAGAITEAAFRDTLPKLRHGMTTLDLISEVDYQLKRHGSTAPSFVTSFYNMGVNHPFDFHNRAETLLLPLEAPVSAGSCEHVDSARISPAPERVGIHADESRGWSERQQAGFGGGGHGRVVPRKKNLGKSGYGDQPQARRE